MKGKNLCSVGINNPVVINIASVHIIKCYGENAKNFGLVNIFMLFGCLIAHVTACSIQRDLNTDVFGGYTDMFPIACTNSIRYHYNKIISLIKGIYKSMINI